jgi:hypothetical protein
MTGLEARRAARTLFPTWSRAARARWVRARLLCSEPRVPISTAVTPSPEYQRVYRPKLWWSWGR